MMKNRLLSNEQRAEGIKNDPKNWSEQRCTGQSTALALIAIGEAMKHPGTKVLLMDHFTGLDSYNSSENLKVVVEELIEKLGAKFLDLTLELFSAKHAWFITYNIFKDTSAEENLPYKDII